MIIWNEENWFWVWLWKCSYQKPPPPPPLAIRVFFKPPGFLWAPCLICFTVAPGHGGEGDVGLSWILREIKWRREAQTPQPDFDQHFYPWFFRSTMVHDGTIISFVFLSTWCVNPEIKVFWLRQRTMMSSFGVNAKTYIFTLMKVLLMVIHAVSIVSSQMWNFPASSDPSCGHLLVLVPLSPDMLNQCLPPLCYPPVCALCVGGMHCALCTVLGAENWVQCTHNATWCHIRYPGGAVFSAWKIGEHNFG